MPKENISGFDFTKDFTEQELFDLLKDEIVKCCEERYRLNENDMMFKPTFSGEVLAYEVNNKLYSVRKILVDYKVPDNTWRNIVLIVTPFNCYVRNWGEDSILDDKQKHEGLTTAFRKIMKDKYGEVYIQAGKIFSQEVREFKIGLEEDLFKHKKKLINMKYEDDVKNFEL